MNLIGIFILTALIFEFALHRLSEALNLRSASAKVPDSFKDLYDSKRYARAQDYLKARTRFAWISSGVFLAATLAFWWRPAFGHGVKHFGSILRSNPEKNLNSERAGLHIKKPFPGFDTRKGQAIGKGSSRLNSRPACSPVAFTAQIRTRPFPINTFSTL